MRLKQEDQFGMIERLLNAALDEPFEYSALPSLLFLRLLIIKPPWRYQVMFRRLFGGYRKYQGTYRTCGQNTSHIETFAKSIIDILPHSHANKFTEKFRQLQRFIHGASMISITDMQLGWALPQLRMIFSRCLTKTSTRIWSIFYAI